MKPHVLLSILLLVFVACNQKASSNATIDFIPGIYTAYYENEFHKTFDTLVIKQNIAGNRVYDINRAIYYTTMVDGKTLTPVYKKEATVGLFDEKNNILVEQTHGSIISFDPANNTLQKGNIKYKKLN